MPAYYGIPSTEAARRSRKRDNASSKSGTRYRKPTISCQAGEDLILFFRNIKKLRLHFRRRHATRALGAKRGDDSLMAPQVIENAQNGRINAKPQGSAF
ncbi:MAG TPA: hypothetical protein VGG79_14930 [Roseiarcus sp.]|jgi:hypothetical protein